MKDKQVFQVFITLFLAFALMAIFFLYQDGQRAISTGILYGGVSIVCFVLSLRELKTQVRIIVLCLVFTVGGVCPSVLPILPVLKILAMVVANLAMIVLWSFTASSKFERDL